MTTVLLILAAVAIVAVLLAVMYQCCTSPLMWVMHLCCDTVGTLLQGLWWCVEGACKGLLGGE